MKAVSGSLRLEVAQHRDMAVFAQFGADVDAATAKTLKHGETLMEMLRQSERYLYSLSDQVALLIAAGEGYFADTPKRGVRREINNLLAALRDRVGVTMHTIDTAGKLDTEDREGIAEICRAMRKQALQEE